MRIPRIDSGSTPSPWMTRKYLGNTLYPFVFFDIPILRSRISRHFKRTSIGLPESGRMTSVPPESRTSSRSSSPQ